MHHPRSRHHGLNDDSCGRHEHGLTGGKAMSFRSLARTAILTFVLFKCSVISSQRVNFKIGFKFNLTQYEKHVLFCGSDFAS